MVQNTNWSQSVGGVVLRGDEILLVRHTYGSAKGKLLIPGGYVQFGEMPEAAVEREVREDTGVEAAVNRLIGIRFQKKDWYAVFLLDYVSGEPKSDMLENDFAGFVKLDRATGQDDITGLSKIIVESIANNPVGMELHNYYSGENRSDYMLYGL